MSEEASIIKPSENGDSPIKVNDKGCNNPGYDKEGDTSSASSNSSDRPPSYNDNWTVEETKKEYENAEDDPDYDPWQLPETSIEITDWKDLSTGGKIKRVLWDYVGRIVCILLFLYMFICSLDFLSQAFQLLGGKAAGEVFRNNEILSNPVAGVMIGVLVTVLVQSSSTSTAIVITMVAESILTVRNAIPIIMGANIGTSVTNTIVSLGQITSKSDFRRAFAGATVHDFFNWLSVLILLPIEAFTGYLFYLSEVVVDSMSLEKNAAAKQDMLKVITKPFTNLVIQVDKKVIEEIAQGKLNSSASLIKHCCKKSNVVQHFNETMNSTYQTGGECLKKCQFAFEHIANSWSDAAIGGILLVASLALMLACLICIVKLLHAILRGRIAKAVKNVINADFPGKCSHFTGYLAILVGAGLTIVLQSSSIFTSSLVPLVGVGVVSIERMYPLTLGSNIGTTATGVLASLAQDSGKIRDAMQVAMCHLFFNISGILIFYPIPFMRVPIKMAKFIGNEVAKYRWFAFVYLALMFFIFPAAVFGLSLPGWYVMAGVLIPIAAVFLFVLIISLIQRKRKSVLPAKLQDWKFLPEPMRSLAPYDRVFTKVKGVFRRTVKLDHNVQTDTEAGTRREVYHPTHSESTQF